MDGLLWTWGPASGGPQTPLGLLVGILRLILFHRVRSQREAVARPIRDPELAILALRHAVEEVGRRPVDPLGEEAVAQRAEDLQRQLVDDMGRDQRLVSGGQAADAQRLAEP